MWLLTSLLALFTPQQELWWQVELRLEVTGHYEYKEIPESNEGITGHYTVNLSSLSGMERDNGDYILYPGEGEISKVRWVESIAGKQGSRTMDLSDQIKPEIKVHYVLRRRGKIYIDFEMASPWVTMERAAVLPDLLLPRSEENRLIHGQEKYNKDVKKGSNRVLLPEDPIYDRQESSRNFHWEWRRENLSGSHAHTVNCRVKISRFHKGATPDSY